MGWYVGGLTPSTRNQINEPREDIARRILRIVVLSSLSTSMYWETVEPYKCYILVENLSLSFLKNSKRWGLILTKTNQNNILKVFYSYILHPIFISEFYPAEYTLNHIGESTTTTKKPYKCRFTSKYTEAYIQPSLNNHVLNPYKSTYRRQNFCYEDISKTQFPD